MGKRNIDITHQEKKRLGELIKRLDEFKGQIEKINTTHQHERYFEIMRNASRFIASIDDPRLCELFSHSNRYDELRRFFRHSNFYYLRAMEANEANTVMTKKIVEDHDFIKYLNNEQILDRYKKKLEDIRLLDLSKAKTMVIVGCGPMPETIFFVVENTPLKRVIGLDTSQEAVFTARKLVSSLGYKYVEILNQGGAEFDYGEVDIVYIAASVRNKQRVLNRIVDTGKKSVQIVIRRAILLQTLLYEDVIPNMNRQLKVAGASDTTSSFNRHQSVKLVRYDI